jgi:sterol desaturase/sphingolipid hydroxylase (fatty acid hydroxylase superfamily)
VRFFAAGRGWWANPSAPRIADVDYSVNFGAIYEFTDQIFGTLVKAPMAPAAEMAQRVLEKSYDYAKNAPTLKNVIDL